MLSYYLLLVVAVLSRLSFFWGGGGWGLKGYEEKQQYLYGGDPK